MNKPLRELLLLLRCASVDCVIPVRPGATKSLTQLASLPPDLSPFSFLLVSADSAQLFYYRHSFRRVLPDSWASAHRGKWGQLTPSPLENTPHTHTHPFNGHFSGTTQVSRYQKGKTNLDFTEARDSEWQWHQLEHMRKCAENYN